MHPRVQCAQARISRVIIEYLHRQENRGTTSRSRFYFDLHWVRMRQPRPLIIRIPEDRFADISLDFSDPLVLCYHLEDALDLPEIPSRRVAHIPTTNDIQDIPVLVNPHADFDLTIHAFARGLATWLKRRHPEVLARLQ